MGRHALLAVTIALWGCSAAGSSPEQVAEDFWLASKNGDAERARELVLSTSQAKIKEPETGKSQVGDYALGASQIDGDQATVETTLSGLSGMSRDLSFNTVLAREDGVWKIDLDATTGAMTKALFGTSMEEMAQQMGNAMGEAMKGMMEGMAEGVQTMGDSLAAASSSEGK
jgi:hypothetical protein